MPYARRKGFKSDKQRKAMFAKLKNAVVLGKQITDFGDFKLWEEVTVNNKRVKKEKFLVHSSGDEHEISTFTRPVTNPRMDIERLKRQKYKVIIPERNRR
jgi:hypothetical protein